MKFELLFKKGKHAFRVQKGLSHYAITLKISNKIVTAYSYQLFACRDILDEILDDLIQYVNKYGFQMLQRDGIIVDASSDKIKVYELEIEIENLTKAKTHELSTSNPDNINSHRTTFIFNFNDFCERRNKLFPKDTLIFIKCYDDFLL